MPQPLELARRSTQLQELEGIEAGFNYVCRRCDVWGRVPAGVGRRCWLCERTDRLERR